MTAPIFVVGSDRSGTTLLRLMLTCHPSVAIPPESRFALELHRVWGSVQLERAEQVQVLCDDLYANIRFREWQIEREILEQAISSRLPLGFAEFVALVYMTYAGQHQAGATHWGDKNPAYAMHLPWLWRVFPDARVIHIIRDGRAVFNSFLDANRKAGRRLWPETVSAAARSWTVRVTEAMKHQTSPNYADLRYENLVQSPEAELRQICDFLNLVYDPIMLDFAEANLREELVPSHRIAWHDATLKPVQDLRIAAWQQTLTSSEIARFELMAGKQLLRCGYSLQESRLGRFGVVNTITLYLATLMRKAFGCRV